MYDEGRTNKLEEEQIRIRNGHCVINALSQNVEITEDDLLKCFITSTDEPHYLVQHELKRILDHGVASGFIVNIGNKYALPKFENIYEADADDDYDDESCTTDEPTLEAEDDPDYEPADDIDLLTDTLVAGPGSESPDETFGGFDVGLDLLDIFNPKVCSTPHRTAKIESPESCAGPSTSAPETISVAIKNPSSSSFKAELATSSTGTVISISKTSSSDPPTSRKRGSSGGGPLAKVKKETAESTTPSRRSPRTKPGTAPRYKF